MGVDAIDQTICPSVLGMTKCSIAFGRWPHAVEHLVISSTSGQIDWSIASTPINSFFFVSRLSKIGNKYYLFYLFLTTV
jgi:hypothetical protein